MEFFADHYFHIGFAHLGGGKPCQDYAISQMYKNAALAAVSDGCSTGENTDIGSRIIALAAIAAMRDYRDLHHSLQTPLEINIRQEIVLAEAQKILNLSARDMLATCVYAYISSDGGFIHIKGDGALAFKYKSGHVVMSHFEWANNMPYYPAYKNGSLDNFIQAQGNDLQAIRLVEEKWCRNCDGEVIAIDRNEYALAEGIEGITINIPEQALKEDLEFVAIFSDGINQIDRTDWREAIFDFMNFKSVKGEFAKRRMIRGIKSAEAKGRGPLDDISYAVIRVEKDDQKEEG